MSLSPFLDCQSTLEPLFRLYLLFEFLYNSLFSSSAVFTNSTNTPLLKMVEYPRFERGSFFKRQVYIDYLFCCTRIYSEHIFGEPSPIREESNPFVSNWTKKFIFAVNVLFQVTQTVLPSTNTPANESIIRKWMGYIYKYN